MVSHIVFAVLAGGVCYCIDGCLTHWTDASVVATVSAAHASIVENRYWYEGAILLTLVLFYKAASRVVRHYRSGTNALVLGMIYGSRNEAPEDREKSNTNLNRLADKSTNICIWGATGWDTFGKDTAPLHKAVQTCNGSVRIILAYPESRRVEERVQHLFATDGRTTLERYKKEIYNSLLVAKRLYDAGRQVEVKLYMSYPTWKMVILDTAAWLQQYPLTRHVSQSPCSVYEKLKNCDMSVYDNIVGHFERYWNGPRGYHVNLSDLSFQYVDNNAREMVHIILKPPQSGQLQQPVVTRTPL